MVSKKASRIIWRILAVIVLLIFIGVGIIRHYWGNFHVQPGASVDSPAPLARWPWPHARTDNPHPGVTHWIDKSSPDGTVLELFDFDFQKNPHLKLELYDQDEDDKVPFDDKAIFHSRAVGQVTRHLNNAGRGKVVAAWNGLFFQYTGDVAGHVAPVVLNGKVRYNVGVIRWSVGVKYKDGKPTFKVMRLPSFQTLSTEYDYAAEGASCLIYNGRPLRLQPFPEPGANPFPLSKPPAEGEAGFVHKVDHIRTSRTSMAWSKDNRHFCLLIVKEPDAEAPSIVAFKNRLPLMGGWTVADLQRFWKQQGAWCAVNLDGGDVTQTTILRNDGRYDLIPARWGCDKMRMTLPPNLEGAPPGGSMMYFFIRDTQLNK